jgi:hypothetical protein
MRGTRNVTGRGVMQLPFLTRLFVDENTDSISNEYVSGLTNLEMLSLGKNQTITNDGIMNYEFMEVDFSGSFL